MRNIRPTTARVGPAHGPARTHRRPTGTSRRGCPRAGADTGWSHRRVGWPCHRVWSRSAGGSGRLPWRSPGPCRFRCDSGSVATRIAPRVGGGQSRHGPSVSIGSSRTDDLPMRSHERDRDGTGDDGLGAGPALGGPNRADVCGCSGSGDAGVPGGDRTCSGLARRHVGATSCAGRRVVVGGLRRRSLRLRRSLRGHDLDRRG